MNPGRLLPVGAVLDSGREVYTIVSVLGSGEFSVTYKAMAAGVLGNAPVPVAIKELHEAAAVDRFMDNAGFLARISGKNRNIVRVSDLFSRNGKAYCVMEFLDGPSLAQYVRERGKLSVNETMWLMEPVVRAVAFLHEQGMTHLDIKPSNIMVVTAGSGRLRPVLIDFDEAYPSGKMKTGDIAAGISEGYAPLEQYCGMTAISPASDVYSLGATLIFCLTGRRPPKAVEVRRGYPSSVLTQCDDLNFVMAVDRAMSPDASDRQSDAGVLWEELTDVTRHAGPLPPPVKKVSVPDASLKGSGKKSRQASGKKSPATIVAVTVAVALLIGAVTVALIVSRCDRAVKVDEMYPEIPEIETVPVPSNETSASTVTNEVAPASDAESAGLRPVMHCYDFNGYFEDSNGRRWPVKLRANTDDMGRWGGCEYTNVSYGTRLDMSGSGADGSFVFRSTDSTPLTISVTSQGSGEWRGTASSGSTTMTCVLYE